MQLKVEDFLNFITQTSGSGNKAYFTALSRTDAVSWLDQDSSFSLTYPCDKAWKKGGAFCFSFLSVNLASGRGPVC